jgi:hypothetical protein
VSIAARLAELGLAHPGVLGAGVSVEGGAVEIEVAVR